jgi:putative copper export protein/mono/diheme cytochrome c family protein
VSVTALETGLTVARAAQLAGALSLLGALTVRCLVVPFPLRRVTVLSAVLVGIAGTAWLALQTVALSGSISAFAEVVTGTRFGREMALRLVLLVVAAVLAGPGNSRFRTGFAAVLAACGVALQAGYGHAAAVEDPSLMAASALHMLAAGAWLGGLMPLWLALETSESGTAARRFTPLGVVCVLTLAVTALIQGLALIGGLPGLVGTDYGRIALLKLTLFLALLVVAAVNSVVLVPRLAREPDALRQLRRNVLVEAGLGVAVIAAAATLASLPPGAHEQPDWPFAWRPSLTALADPDLRREVVEALVALGVVPVLAVLGIALRGLRWPAFLAAAVVALLATPHVGLLLVEAYPTSYFVSPTGFDSTAIVEGASLYPANCASCHGQDGRGAGPLATTLDVPPADLTAEHLWDHSDGELFWWLSHGMDAVGRGRTMPGFAGMLNESQRWALIDFIRARNAGVAVAAGGSWPHRVQAPGLEAICAGGHMMSLADFHGQPVRIIAGPPQPDPGPAIATIYLSPAADREEPPPVQGCIAAAPEAWGAYAIVSGQSSAALGGTIFLVDPAGWLRYRHPPQAPEPGAAVLAGEIAEISSHPLPSQEAAHAHHH